MTTGASAAVAALRLAYLGPPGTFAHQALQSMPPVPGAELVAAASVPAAVAAVRDGEVDAALVPFENSVEGAVAATLDALADLTLAPLVISADVLLPVKFALLARPGQDLDAIKVVATHPHAEAQCRAWLAARLPDAEVVLTASTATGARDVAAGRYDAAVSAAAAAAVYGLDVLDPDIADSGGGVTRFVLVCRPGAPPAPTGADRTTVVLYEREDHPGALLEMLTEFAARGVNLTRLESRPTGAGLGRYCFHVDADGHVADARVGETLTALRRLCAEVRFLGSYPRADGVATPPVRAGNADADYSEAAGWLAGLRSGSQSRD